MGFGFRESIKILPGVRVNLSKSGISTSIGVKGFTYNTRGRITTSIPGTGIYHVTNLRTKGARQPSRRQSASLEFRMRVQERVVCALRGYFLSHGIYVSEANLGQATELVEHDAPRITTRIPLRFPLTQPNPFAARNLPGATP
jgi:hypothetical protein